MHNTPKPWLAMGGLILATMLWSTSLVVLKIALAKYHAYMLVFGRMLVATLCFIPFFYRRRHAWKLQPGSLKYLLFMSLCEPCLYFLFEVEALKQTTASQAGIITAILPLMVAMAASGFLRERMTGRMMTGLVLAMTGVVWLSTGATKSMVAPNPVLGNVLELLAMVCATGYILTAKRLTSHFGYSPFLITASQAFVGVLFYTPLLALPGIQLPHHWDAGFFLAIGYLGAFITLGAYGLYNYGISRIPAGQAAAFINLIPVFTVFWAWLILDERFSGQQCLAAVIILTGVFLSQIERRNAGRSAGG